MTSIFFHTWCFWAKKHKKIFENFFSIRSSYFSKLIKDTETVLFREEQHRYRLLFGPWTNKVTVIKYDAFVFLPKIHFIFLKKISFIFFVLSSKHPRLSRLDKFTWLWALKHKEFVTPSADHWTFLLVPKRDMSFLVGVFEENPDSYSG